MLFVRFSSFKKCRDAEVLYKISENGHSGFQLVSKNVTLGHVFNQSKYTMSCLSRGHM